MNRSDYLGCLIDPAETEAFCAYLAGKGVDPLWKDAKRDLRGYGEGRCVFLWEAEQDPRVWGQMLHADSQARGTCVSRGTYRAAQDALYWGIAFGGLIGKKGITLAYEPIYGGSRVNVGNGRLGNGDGSYGAWAAQYVHDYGLIPRGQYGSIDLTKSNESLAVTWGTPRHGVPSSIIAESLKSEACFNCCGAEDIRDAVAAGYGVAFCCNSLWQVPDSRSSSRDADGMCRPVDSGGHCEEIRGVYQDYKGRLCFVRQNSWGNYPRGPDKIKLYDGREVPLPEGAYGSFATDNESALKAGGEAWAIAPPAAPWRDGVKPSEV